MKGKGKKEKGKPWAICKAGREGEYEVCSSFLVNHPSMA